MTDKYYIHIYFLFLIIVLLIFYQNFIYLIVYDMLNMYNCQNYFHFYDLKKKNPYFIIMILNIFWVGRTDTTL